MDKVTVVVPSYNHKAFVTECINSVLNQDYSDVELIVVDDGSKDGSPELLKELARQKGFQLVLKGNEGVCATINHGLKLATGDFIIFLASDDFMPITRISEQIQAFRTHPDADVIAGSVRIIDEQSNNLSSKKVRGEGYLTIDQMFRKNMVYAPTVMFKKETFQKYGHYKTNYIFEDYYMWLRILHSGGRILNIDREWAFYRITTVNLEKRFTRYYQGYVQTLSDYLPDVRAKAALNHYLLIYCAKMTFLQGRLFLKSNSDKVFSLKFHHRIALNFISFIPETLRQKILLFLMKEL